ncbi:hypothetical protein ABEB36_014159 [Hypothenemus hampei]|uniref:Uncharacterized protein n=1 Tax=Hypothenemus hampei TaxID=57062 RepID=A0ABD1E4B7_HYPHA
MYCILPKYFEKALNKVLTKKVDCPWSKPIPKSKQITNLTGVEDTDRITGYRPDGSVNPCRCIILILNSGQRHNCLNHHHQDNCKYRGDNDTKEVKENQLVRVPAPKRLS